MKPQNDLVFGRFKARTHAIARARERFGVRLTMDDIMASESAMRLGQFPIISVNTRAVSFAAELGGNACRAVYDTVLDCIITIVPAPVQFTGNPDPRIGGERIIMRVSQDGAD